MLSAFLTKPSEDKIILIMKQFYKEEAEGDKFDIKCQQKNRYTELLFRMVF